MVDAVDITPKWGGLVLALITNVLNDPPPVNSPAFKSYVESKAEALHQLTLMAQAADAGADMLRRIVERVVDAPPRLINDGHLFNLIEEARAMLAPARVNDAS